MINSNVTSHENKEFCDLHDQSIFPWQRRKVIENQKFTSCSFQGCSLSMTDDPKKRTIIRNVILEDCFVSGTFVFTPIVEDSLVEGLKTADLLPCWGAVFKHVVLRGKIGRIMISRKTAIISENPRRQARLQASNREFYREVDWALDISDAQFSEADLRGVPGHLIRRDPESQFLVKRKNLD